MSYFKEQLLKTALDEMSEYPVNSEEYNKHKRMYEMLCKMPD